MGPLYLLEVKTSLLYATLGSSRDAQRIEAIEGEGSDNFMLHYNFPAYSVGEIGMPMGPKRREIGHGNLAKEKLRLFYQMLTIL